MKFIVAVLAALATASAVQIKDPRFPDRTDNWATDPLHNFDDNHYANNKVNSIFPEKVNVPNKSTVWGEAATDEGHRYWEHARRSIPIFKFVK